MSRGQWDSTGMRGWRQMIEAPMLVVGGGSVGLIIMRMARRVKPAIRPSPHAIPTITSPMHGYLGPIALAIRLRRPVFSAGFDDRSGVFGGGVSPRGKLRTRTNMNPGPLLTRIDRVTALP